MTSRFLGSMVWGSCSHHVLLTVMQQGSKWQVRSRNMTAVLQMHVNLPARTHNKPCWEAILYAYISGVCLAFCMQSIFVKLLGGPQAWGTYTFKWLTLLSVLFVVKLLWSKKTESKEHGSGSQMSSGGNTDRRVSPQAPSHNCCRFFLCQSSPGQAYMLHTDAVYFDFHPT